MNTSQMYEYLTYHKDVLQTDSCVYYLFMQGRASENPGVVKMALESAVQALFERDDRITALHSRTLENRLGCCTFCSAKNVFMVAIRKQYEQIHAQPAGVGNDKYDEILEKILFRQTQKHLLHR